MLKWLAGLIGPELQKVAQRDLERLNAVKPGLGDDAADYVRSGRKDLVLSTIGVHRKGAGNPLEICSRYLQDRKSSPTLARRQLLALADPYPCDAAQRYAEVLAAAGDLSDAPGSASVPGTIRVLLGEVALGVVIEPNTWPQQARSLDGKGFTVDIALEMVRRLGGTATDLVDCLYGRGAGYSAISAELYRRAVDLRPLAANHIDAFVAAGRRIAATARADLIRDLANWSLCTDPKVVEFLVEQVGDSAKAARESASSALMSGDIDAATTRALEVLGSGSVAQRSGIVDWLARVRSPRALEALRAHRDNEKTARIVAAIDTALAVASEAAADRSESDDSRGYTALDGQRIAIPELVALEKGRTPVYGDADRTALRAAIAEANTRARQQNEENARQGYNYRARMIDSGKADDVVDLMNRPAPKPEKKEALQQFCNWGPGASWMRSALAKMSDTEAFAWAAWLGGSARTSMRQTGLPGGQRLRAFLESPRGDLRHLEQIDIAAGAQLAFGGWRERKNVATRKGDFLRDAIQTGYNWHAGFFFELPPHAVWPYLAENLDVLDEAFGLKPEGEVKLDRAEAIRMLTLLPATPARFFAPLLEAATQETRAGRAEARKLLGDRPEVARRLLALLDDSRQALRAGAADWLAQRKDTGAVDALRARLRKEKSELARAAMVTALRRLGEDVTEIVGPAALLEEARKGLRSVKLDKLAWLGLEHLPRVHYRNGDAVPREVLTWWVSSAHKLKQPGGNALFELYLEQLKPQDAAALSAWILDAWLAYDTARPNEQDANAHAKAHAPGRLQAYLRWVKDYTEERAFADLHREYMSQYPNSGADSKGLLGLAVRAPSAMAADRVRAYLKNHGQRTSQASALLEMLASIGDPVALQVVIAAATRLKQKGVQELAGQLVTKIAESRNWSLDELSDRTIPAAGFDDDGVLRLTCGEEGRLYEGRLTADLTVVLRNPAGKEVSGVPAGKDEATSAAKKQLATTKKELKQIYAMQSARLYEALCSARTWPTADWQELYREHPVMRKLVERVVWLGLDADGRIVTGFRPTAEGDLTDQADAPVRLEGFATVRLAHGALLDEATAAAWQRHLDDYGVKPLFAQFGRAHLQASVEQADATAIVDRKGWLTDTFTLRGAATKLGYERGAALDGGAFNEYRKTFNSAGIIAVIEFTGSTLPEENIPAALISLKFEKITRGRGGVDARLGDVPPVLLSECWNDYHAMAAKGAYDAEWQRKGLW